MLIVRTPVRISFGGGGTDLPSYFERYGGAVLSSAISRYFYTILQRRDDGHVQVISSDLRVSETWEDISKMDLHGSELEIPLAAMKELGYHPSVDLFLASEIPPGTGLGSSASVCVNVLHTLAVHSKRHLSRYELAERAYHIARNVLGKPVGKQDEYAAAFGGLNYISFNSDGAVRVDPLGLPPDLVKELDGNLLLFHTGVSHNSWSILKEQEAATESKAQKSTDALHRIRELADRMRDVLLQGELRRFGELLHEGWEQKKKVSAQISTSRIDQLYSLARDNGAVGGKVTGAGGGGFLLVYCERDAQSAVRRALAGANAREMPFSFDFEGAHAVVNDPFLDQDDNSGSQWVYFSFARSVSPAGVPAGRE